MAYRFTGFFARPARPQPAALPAGAVWREITAPFAGVGVRLSALPDDEPGPQEVRQLLTALGLDDARDWVYLHYVTWGGGIDGVYGLGSSGGRVFGPVNNSDHKTARATYIEIMAEFGVSEADAINFPPFERGFWGE